MPAKGQKILHIVRHGKALQDYHHLADTDRPLIEKGVCNNIEVAERLKEKYQCPDLIISSPAIRALHTAHIFARVFGYPSSKVRVDDSLYMRGDEAALDIIYTLQDHIGSVMLVAHNPDFTYLSNRFIRPLINSLPTSGVVSVTFTMDHWDQLYTAEHHAETEHLKSRNG